MTEYFSEYEILNTIKNSIEDYKSADTFRDMFDDLFNTNEYIIGYQKAKDALEKYGVFDALEEVQRWDIDNYGHWYTDYTNSEAVANTLEYIHAYNIFDSILTNAPGFLNFDSELTPQNVKYFKEALNEM